MGPTHSRAGCVTSAGRSTSLSSTLLLGQIKASSRGVVHGAGSPPGSRSPAPACRQRQPCFPPGEQGFRGPNTPLVIDLCRRIHAGPGGLLARQGAPSAEQRLLERPRHPERPPGGSRHGDSAPRAAGRGQDGRQGAGCAREPPVSSRHPAASSPRASLKGHAAHFCGEAARPFPGESPSTPAR